MYSCEVGAEIYDYSVQSNSSLDTIQANNYGFTLSIGRSSFPCAIQKKSIAFINQSYAFSCDCPENYKYMPHDSIKELSIITLNDFNTSKRSGDTINEYFEIHSNGVNYNINNYIQNNYNASIESGEINKQIRFKLTTIPETNSFQKFRVHLTLSNGDTASVSIREIYLN